jgi:hypothetical protein
MSKMVIAAILAVVAISVAWGRPDALGDVHSGRQVARRTDRDRPRPATQGTPTTASAMLEQLSPAERENACISVEFASSDADLVALGHEVERLWNGGEFEAALAQLDNLEAHVGPVAIGTSWRKPVPTMEAQLWDDDVRIGNRDSIRLVAFDIHRVSGNLFAVLLFDNGTGSQWTANFSDDGGQTWSETYTWNALYHLRSLSASVLASHCYIAFGRGSAQDQALLYRCKASDGTQEDFNDGSRFVTVFTTGPSDSIREVALSSNQDSLNNRLYYTAITTAGSLAFWWADTGALSWHEIATGVDNAGRGLSAATNQGFDSLYAWVSYYDESDSLRIGAVTESDVWVNVTSRAGTAYASAMTSIGAYKDTILCSYVCRGAAGNWCRYVTSYNGGGDWAWLFLDPDTMTTSESPAVALRKGGGEGAVYRYYTPTRELRYTWRDYSGTWGTPVAIADYEPYYNRPAIEYLGSNAYGVVYIRWSNYTAYFDRSDWTTGLAQQRRLLMDESILNVVPNPLSGYGRLFYTLNRPSDLRVQVYDRTGRVVRTLFNGHSAEGVQSLSFDVAGLTPGVYFVRADAGGRALTIPMTVVR